MQHLRIVFLSIRSFHDKRAFHSSSGTPLSRCASSHTELTTSSGTDGLSTVQLRRFSSGSGRAVLMDVCNFMDIDVLSPAQTTPGCLFKVRVPLPRRRHAILRPRRMDNTPAEFNIFLVWLSSLCIRRRHSSQVKGA